MVILGDLPLSGNRCKQKNQPERRLLPVLSGEIARFCLACSVRRRRLFFFVRRKGEESGRNKKRHRRSDVFFLLS